MKKLILGLMLMAGITFAQTGSITCNTNTALDSAGVFTAAYEGPLTGYNSIGLTVYANVSSATNGVVVEYAVKLSTGAYRVIKRYSFSYTAGDIGFTKYMPIDAPYMRVVYTNGATDQTTFSLFVMKHGESNSPTTTDGKVDIAGATSNGALEATQLQVLAEMQNRINLGGLQTYSSKRGDFTVTPKNGSKTATITGATFTVSAGSMVYASKRTIAGVWSFIPLTTATDSVAGSIVKFDAMTTNFASTDVVDIMFIQPEKTIDKANDASKSLEQSPLWARYQIDEIYDGTNLAAATNYYPSATGASMDGYKNLSFTGKLIDADSTVTLTVECTNDEDASTADWVQVYVTDLKNNTTVNSIAASHTTTTFAIKLTDFNYSLFRVKVVTGDATNTVIIKQRRIF